MKQFQARLLVGVCAFAVAVPAMAQTSPGADERAEQDEGIVVTGSRIVRRDFTAESPITTVSADFIKDTGPATVEQTLNTLPQFQASQGAQTSSLGTATAGASGGRASANLRGLGAQRTLVLFDGRRLQPSDTQGTIDLNTITSSLISSVEVITGGASAVYGSDAVAGVVNFRFNNRFRGLALEADAGITEMGDGATQSASLTWGGQLGDSVRLFASTSYMHRGTASRNDRSFFDTRAGTSTPTNGLIVVSGSNLFGTGSAANVAAFRSLFTSTYGTTVPVASSSYFVNTDRTIVGRTGAVNLRPDGTNNFYVDPSGSALQRGNNDSTLILPIDRYTGFARAEIDLAPSVTLYAQGAYTRSTTDQTSEAGTAVSIVGPVQIRADNPFINGDIRTLANARPRPNDPLTYYFVSTRFGQFRVRQEYEVYQGMIGIKGDLGSNLHFDVYGSYGETHTDEMAFNQVSRSRFNDLINGVGSTGLADGGASKCAGGFDPFSFAPVSDACKAYAAINTVNRYAIKQGVLQGNLSGSLFTLPGGDVGFAVGAEYRKNSYSADIDPSNSPTPTATPGVFTFPDTLGTNGSSSASGSLSVREGYAEILVPILKDVPFFHSLEADIAYRYSDYDRFGGVSTYKFSGTWQPVKDLTVRGGYSRAIRAPSLGDLFAPRAGALGVIGSVASGQGDPCDYRSFARTGKIANVDPAKVTALCIANGVPAAVAATYTYASTATAAVRIGNPALNPEVADSYTIGAAFQPSFAQPLFRNLSFSVDYYSIDVRRAIGYITSSIALNQCFNVGGLNANYDPANYYCGLIHRDGAGILSQIDEQLANLANYRASGIDFQLDAAIGVGALGTLSLNSAVTYVLDYKIQSISTEPTYDFSGTIGNAQIDGFSNTHPRWKHVTTVTLGGKSGSLSLRWRYIGKMTDSANVVSAGSSTASVPAVSYFDLTGRIKAGDGFELRGGITNLTNKAPPQFGGPATTSVSTYDVIGRRFFIGATARF